MVLMRRIARCDALNGVRQRMDPPDVAAGHLDDAHITEEDDCSRYEVRDGSHEHCVAGAAAPGDRAGVHGRHVGHRAPAEQWGAAGGQSLQPDPQDHSAGAPQGAAGAVAQAVHDGVVAVEGDGRQRQRRGRAVDRGGVPHVETEILPDRGGGVTASSSQSTLQQAHSYHAVT